MRVMLPAFVLVASLVSPVFGMDEDEFIVKLRSLQMSCKGASEPTRQRLLDKFAADVHQQIVSFSRVTLEGFGEVSLNNCQDFGFDGGGIALVCTDSWQNDCFGGYSACSVTNEDRGGARTSHCYLRGDPPRSGSSGLSWLSEQSVRGAVAVYFEKSYQDQTIRYSVTTQDTSLVDSLRVGQKSEVKIKITGFTEKTGNSLVGVLLSAKPETSVLRCSNGHEFAPSAGYSFCPQCGQPLVSSSTN